VGGPAGYRGAVRAWRQRRGEPFAARDHHRRGRRYRSPRAARRRPSPGRDVMTLDIIVGDFVDRDFARETEFLAKLVKVPSDNPPGDCAAHAAPARQLLDQLLLTVQPYPVPQPLVAA